MIFELPHDVGSPTIVRGEEMSASSARLVFFEKWVDPVAERLLKESEGVEVRRLTHDAPQAESHAAMREADGYQILPRVELCEPWYADARLIGDYSNLLAICSTGSGYDVIDVDACTEAGIIVCNQAGTNAQAVAEHAVGMMLGLAKKIVSLDRAVRRTKRVERYSHPGNNLAGKTVGIIGLGHIGRLTAHICKAGFSMRVLAHDPYLSEDEIVRRQAEPTDFRTLLANSDFVSVHCPRTNETMGLFGAEEFAHMRAEAFFINTARGGIHDEDALDSALKSGQIAGAGLDVFLEEPPSSDHPLMRHDTVIANPHSAGLTIESLYQMSVAAAEQWIEIFSGAVPPRLINPEAWPYYSERFTKRFGFSPAVMNEGRPS